MTIQYNKEDLKDNSAKVLSQYETMNEALNNLKNLINNINTHWNGADKAAYIEKLTEQVTTLESYLSELKTIATNLSTAADYYAQHEEHFSQDLW